VISDPNDLDADVRNAIADAASALTAGDPRAHIFYEERTDLRMTLASSGRRDVVVTRTRGAAVSGPHSIHITDPEFLDPGAAARTLSAEDLESVIVQGGAAAGMGRRHPFWSANLVAFEQAIWVGNPEAGVAQDIRRGCRVELRARVGGEGTASAIEEFVVTTNDTRPLADRFSSAFDRAEERLSPIEAMPRGPAAAVFAPGVAGVVVHELIGHALEGDVIARRATWIQGTGLPTAGRTITVVDDPRRGRGAWTIDDEGTRAGETLLIEHGDSVGLLLDRPSAMALGRVSTGHGRRSSYLDSVRPRMGCTFLVAGADDPEDVIRSTRSGVFIRRLAAGHTDPCVGRASFIVTDGDRIIDGRLAGPVQSFVMEIDGLEMWTSIDRVAHDLAFDTCVGSCVRDGQPLAVSVGAPTIRIGVVTVRT
jgi:TldD protein